MTGDIIKRETLQYEITLRLLHDDFMRLLYSNQSRCRQIKFRRYFFDWGEENLHPDYNFVLSLMCGEDGSFIDLHACVPKEGVTNTTEDENGITCEDILNGLGKTAVQQDGSYGLFQSRAQILDKDALETIISEELSQSVSLDILHTRTQLHRIAQIDTTRHILTTKAGLVIDADINEYKDYAKCHAGVTWSSVSFKYDTDDQKESFLKYLKGREIAFEPLTKTAYALALEAKMEIENRHIVKAKEEVCEARRDVIAELERKVDGLTSDVSYLCGIIKNAKDMVQARDAMNKFLLRGGKIRSERNVPVEFLERAKYLLQNYKKDAAQIALCDKSNQGKKAFQYIGITKREYILIKRDHKLLEELFDTTLIDYSDTFELMFKEGLSYAEYAKKHLPVKTKKAGVCAANRTYSALASELMRIHKAEISFINESRSDEKLKILCDKEQEMITAAFMESHGDKSFYDALVREYGELEDLFDDDEE